MGQVEKHMGKTSLARRLWWNFFRKKEVPNLEEVEVEWHGPYNIDTALEYFQEYEDYGLYMITRKWGEYPEKILYIGLTYYQDFSTRLSQHQWWLSTIRGTVKVRVGYLIEDRSSEKRLRDVENLLICWHSPEYNEKGTEPKLDFLITKGPYSFCRHPQYLSFIIIILGVDLMFRSVMGIVFTLVLSIPSMVYRAKIEDELLRNKFGDEWENYADKVGFLFPRVHKKRED